MKMNSPKGTGKYMLACLRKYSSLVTHLLTAVSQNIFI